MNKFAIKISVEDGEKPEAKQFLVECETYGRAEEMAYDVSQSLGFKTFSLESVVKTQIKEVSKDLDPEGTMWLVKYEHGLEAKPDKSNLVVSSPNMGMANAEAFLFLDGLCSGLFITEIKKLDYIDFVKDVDAAVKEEIKGLVDTLKKNGATMSVTFSNGDKEEFFNETPVPVVELDDDFDL
jgi:hypothetical protein